MKPARTRKKTDAVAKPEALLTELRELSLSVSSQVAQTVNAGLTMLYWKVGDRIRREILKEKRAEYGAEILQTLSAKLESEFGNGFREKNLRRMIQFAEVYPEQVNCRIADTTIDLDPHNSAPAVERSTSTGLLR